MRGWRSTLDLAASLAMLGAAAFVVWSHDSSVESRPAREFIGVQAGDDLSQVPGLDVAGGRALVVVVRTTCQYCTASMSFYSEVLRRRHATKVVVIGSESVSELEGYLNSHGVVPDHVVSITTDMVRVPGTPTLLLLDESGRVVQRWAGLLSPATERDVLEHVD